MFSNSVKLCLFHHWENDNQEDCGVNHLRLMFLQPGVSGGFLAYKTVCPSARHIQTTHYNVHSLFGYLEAKATHKWVRNHKNCHPEFEAENTMMEVVTQCHNVLVFASHRVLTDLLGKRSIVISRSTFPGHGHVAGHWSGDISSTWEDLYYSIPCKSITIVCITLLLGKEEWSVSWIKDAQVTHSYFSGMYFTTVYDAVTLTIQGRR